MVLPLALQIAQRRLIRRNENLEMMLASCVKVIVLRPLASKHASLARFAILRSHRSYVAAP